MKKLLRSSILASLCLCMFYASAQEKTYKYTYDELGRLTKVEDSINGDRSYTYDPAGNRTNVAVSSISSSSSSSVVSSIASSSNLPVIIQAESYSDMFDVFTQDTSDVGGGKNVYNFNNTDWMSYQNSVVTVPATGSYQLTYRIASTNGASGIELRELATNALIDVAKPPNTGGWQTWVDVTRTITLTQGGHTFKLVSQSGGNLNINWFRIDNVNSSSSSSALASSSTSLSSNASAPAGSSSSVTITSTSSSSSKTSVASSTPITSSSSSKAPGSSSSSSSSLVISSPGAPSYSELTAGSAKFTWAPSSMAGVGYQCTVNNWVNTVPCSSGITLYTLIPNQTNTFLVRAVYSGVFSSPSSVDVPAPAVSPPGALRFGSIVAAPTSGSATISWDPSSTPGVSYEYSYDSSQGNWSSPSPATNTTVSVTLPSPGRSYDVIVRALLNGVRSTGIHDTLVIPAFSVANPGIPKIESITYTTATASWAPSTTPGATYEYSLYANGPWSPISTTTVGLTNLASGGGYNFTVRALAAGQYSDQISQTFQTLFYDIGPTGTPAIIDGTLSSGSVSMKWAPSGTQDATYEWTVDGWVTVGANSLPRADNQCTLNNLLPSHSYRFEVRVLAPNGRRSSPMYLDFTTPAAPAPLTMVGSLNVGAKTVNSVFISWQPATGNPDADSYEYSLNNTNQWSTLGKVTSATISTGLSPDTPYTISVRARNSGGISNNTIQGSFRTNAPLVSLAMAGVLGVGVSTTNSVGISWQPATGNPGPDSYEYSLDNSSWIPLGMTTSATINTGLSPDTQYTIYVRAKNSGGPSNALQGGFRTKAALAPLVMVGSLGIGTITSNTVDISWQAATGNPVATSYEYSLNDSNQWINVGDIRTITVSAGLSPNTSYKISVRARNASGPSNGALTGGFKTPAIPLVLAGPLRLYGYTTTSLSISWDAATGNPGPDGYEYSYNNNDPWTFLSSSSITLSGLSPDTSYTLYVRAKNAGGTTGSIGGTWKTPPVLLPKPQNARCYQNWGPGAWQGKWDAVPGAHHYVFKEVNKPEVTLYSTNTGPTPMNQSTKPCSWVQACDAAGRCGEPQYEFSNY